MQDREKRFGPLTSPLAKRFILYILLFSSLIAFLGTSLQLSLDYAKDRRNLVQMINQLETTHLQSVINNVWVADLDLVEVQLLEILSLPDIQYLEITEDDEVKVSVGTHDSKDILSRKYPLVYTFRDEKISLGSLYVEASLEGVRQRLFSRVFVILLTQVVTIFLVALFIFLVFHRLVGRHLLTMADYTRTLDPKHLDSPLLLRRSATKRQPDELDHVVASLNQMRTSLQEDIEQRKKTEQELKAERDFINTALDTQPDTFFVMEIATGKALRWNRTFSKVSGYSDEEIVAMKAPDSYYSPEDLTKAAACLEEVMEKGTCSLEISLITKDGRAIPTEYTTSTIKDEHSTPRYLISIGRDITARKQYEKEKEDLELQLRQAYKMEAIGTLAGGIAHDFNNILSIILGYTELVKQELPAEGHLATDLEAVLIAVKRAKSLVAQILSFSRKTGQELRPLKPRLVVEESLKLLRASIPTSIDIQQDIDPECATIIADATQIHQIVINLCTNAVYAMEEKGVLKVSLTETTIEKHNLLHRPDMIPGKYVKLSVSDTGTGMDPERVRKIFDPFFTTKDVGEGTGMGLSVVHGIVMAHHGMITVDSEPGKGATFHVFFAAAENEEVELAEKVAPFATGTERILLVDDEEVVADITGRTLERLGYVVVVDTNSLHALETFTANPHAFDLIVTDQTMPDMSGDELAREILRIRPGMPIMLCTGYSSKISPEAAKALGIREFCMKPLGIRDLAEAVRRILDDTGHTPA